MNIILYTTHCPKCKILENKLREANISYAECTNIDVMRNKGFDWVPVLEVDGECMNYNQALKWIDKIDGGKELGKI